MTRVLAAEVAFPAQCVLAEGPVWDAARGLLRWVDILPGHVHALDPVTGAHARFEAGDPVGTFGLTRDGGLVLALVDGFAPDWPAASACPTDLTGPMTGRLSTTRTASAGEWTRSAPTRTPAR